MEEKRERRRGKGDRRAQSVKSVVNRACTITKEAKRSDNGMRDQIVTQERKHHKRTNERNERTKRTLNRSWRTWVQVRICSSVTSQVDTNIVQSLNKSQTNKSSEKRGRKMLKVMAKKGIAKMETGKAIIDGLIAINKAQTA